VETAGSILGDEGDRPRRLSPEEITAAMNRVCDSLETTKDEFVSAAARRLLERVER
jgi:hypothetical protein